MTTKPTTGALGALGARAASILASFLLTIIVARALGLESSGIFFLILSAIAGFATLGRFGTDNLALKLAGSEDPHVATHVSHLVTLATCASIISAAAAFGMSFALHDDLGGVSTVALASAASAVVPQALAVLAGAILRARGHLAIGTTAELGSTPALAATAVLIGYASGTITIDWAIASLAIASWVTGIWSLMAMWISLRSVRPPRSTRRAITYLRSQLGSLGAMMGTSLIFYVLTWVPVFILSAAGAFEEVSLYTTAARLVGFISLIPAIQVSYLAPRFAQLYQAREISRLNVLAGRNALIAVVLSVPPAAVLIFLPRMVLRTAYGDQFVPAAPALVLLCIGALCAAAAGQVNQLMLLCDLEHFALAINGILLAVWVTGGWYLATTFGLLGVAALGVSTSVSYSLAAVIHLNLRKTIRSFAWRTRSGVEQSPVPAGRW